MIDKYSIGQKIREFRKRSKLSQLDLEIEIDASPGSISRIESGDTNPTKETIHKIGEVLKLTAEETAYLLGVQLNKAESTISDYDALKSAYNKTLLDPYDLIQQYDLKKVLDETINKIIAMGYLSPAIYLKKSYEDIYQLSKSKVTENSYTLAQSLLEKKIYDVEYSLKDQTLITHAILSGEIQVSENVFELIFPHLGEIYSVQGCEQGKIVIALPLVLNSKVIGCITFLSAKAELSEEEKTKLNEFSNSISSMVFTAQVKIEADNKYVETKKNTKSKLKKQFKFSLPAFRISNPLSIDIYMKLYWIIFISFSIWWVLDQIYFKISKEKLNIWSDLYFLMALYAVIIGFKAYKIVGGQINRLGKMILILVLISLGHVIGQIINAFVLYIRGIELLYPSPGEIGFSSSCILSVVLSIYIYKYISNKNASNPIQLHNKTVIILISLVLIFLRYLLHNSSGNYWISQDTKTYFFDALYIIGQSAAVSIALISMVMIRKAIICKETKRFFILYFISSILLFLADTIFILKYHAGTWIWGDIADFMYFLYYSVIGFGHVVLLNTIKKDLKIHKENSQIKDYSKEVGSIVNKLIS